MKTILTALNARFAHSSLALRYLQKYNRKFDIKLMEFSINDGLQSMFSRLIKRKAQVYGFSCYIWNIELILKLSEMVKKALPETFIVLGGPEAGYNSEQILNNNYFVDAVIVGEGEETLGELLSALNQGTEKNNLPDIAGLALRGKSVLCRGLLNLDHMTQPYTPEDINELKGKIIYFETSRGCPFHCTYCLSSAEGRLRAFPMEYVKTGLKMLFDAEVPLVKLIDRTFNYDSRRAAEILRFVLGNSKCTCIHMEIEPRILTDELIEILGSAPKGMFQVEMGIQSANPNTLKAIGREFAPDKAIKNIKKLRKFNNMHIHLDLIAGLPLEDYDSFGKSFDFVYALRPDMLQLGFLKMLKGTAIEQEKGIICTDFPPYEVISTSWLSVDDVCRLKEIEEAVELFYNSGVFSKTIEILTEENAFHVFEKLSEIIVREEKNGKLKRKDWYAVLYNEYGEYIRKALSEDFIRYNKSIPLPEFTRPVRERGFKDKAYKLIKSERFLRKYKVPSDMAVLRFERMDGRAYMMNYDAGELFDITAEMEETEYI